MSVHYRSECKHGTLVSQCRCADPNKTIQIVECPWDCPQKGVEVSFADLMKGPDTSIHQFNAMHSLRQVGWIIGGGPRDGEFLPWGHDLKIDVPHGSLSPVYMEIGD